MSQTTKDLKQTKNTNNKDKKAGTPAVRPENPPEIGPKSLISAALLIAYEIINIILYFVLCTSLDENPQKSRDIEFEQINTFLRLCHFIFHGTVIVFIIFLMLFAFKDFINRKSIFISFGSAFLTLFTFVFWVALIVIHVVETTEVKNQISINGLKEILNDAPMKLIFFYSKDTIKSHNITRNPTNGQVVAADQYLKCYSNSGVSLPLKSELVGEKYTLGRLPQFFYFKIDQVVTMSDDFQAQYNKTIKKIKACAKSGIKIKYYPIINKTFAVRNPVYPKFLTRVNKNIANFLGFGFYYDVYSKSFPFYVYEQKINVDLKEDFNYTKMWTSKWCRTYGKCIPFNRKPSPEYDDL